MNLPPEYERGDGFVREPFPVEGDPSEETVQELLSKKSTWLEVIEPEAD